MLILFSILAIAMAGEPQCADRFEGQSCALESNKPGRCVAVFPPCAQPPPGSPPPKCEPAFVCQEGAPLATTCSEVGAQCRTPDNKLASCLKTTSGLVCGTSAAPTSPPVQVCEFNDQPCTSQSGVGACLFVFPPCMPDRVCPGAFYCMAGRVPLSTVCAETDARCLTSAGTEGFCQSAPAAQLRCVAKATPSPTPVPAQCKSKIVGDFCLQDSAKPGKCDRLFPPCAPPQPGGSTSACEPIWICVEGPAWQCRNKVEGEQCFLSSGKAGRCVPLYPPCLPGGQCEPAWRCEEGEGFTVTSTANTVKTVATVQTATETAIVQTATEKTGGSLASTTSIVTNDDDTGAAASIAVSLSALVLPFVLAHD